MREGRRVVITGLGLVTPLGTGVEKTWSGLLAGRSGIGPITQFDVSAFPTRISGTVPDFVAPEFLDRKEIRRLDRFVQYALIAAAEAMNDAGLSREKIDPARTGVIVGSGIGGLRVMEQEHRNLMNSGPNRVSPFLIPMLIPDIAAGRIAMLFNCQGPNFAAVSACASGAHALGISLRSIQYGEVDLVISGGTESCITPLGLAGFCSMKALSERNDEPARASRPFDRGRDGFVMAEGAGILVLEELEHARRRGARIYAEFSGYGASADAYHITAPDPEGKGMMLAMKMALNDAGLAPEQIDYINAHGTSTQLNDQVETRSIKNVFGTAAGRVPVSSTKSMTGHMLGAAGAVELAAGALVITRGVLPPTINQEEPDPDCDLDYVPNQAREVPAVRAITPP
ncbi:MAG: 3-oxoacyl-(acyl-carrier-protein) synthase 2 [candidate division TA06 bacterium ADurb.Bin417]|uniref:Beta-ketoacyl-ACP synthase II n=1 Tax=candidate division TA06 bacterium ADurb.Bin417 TaxID=1852828 RepID=A0A1V5MLJ0_UNCT6|nr:MAG: 3-oxoacyl-(acyl-carrier-protein) synthase 2 [candidate division TA06 bacterium ADurb.Bin417]